MEGKSIKAWRRYTFGVAQGRCSAVGLAWGDQAATCPARLHVLQGQYVRFEKVTANIRGSEWQIEITKDTKIYPISVPNAVLQQTPVPYSSFTDTVAMPDWSRVHLNGYVHDMQRDVAGNASLLRIRDDRCTFLDVRVPSEKWP